MRRITHRRYQALAAVVVIIAAASAVDATGPDRAGWENGVRTIDLTSYFDANSSTRRRVSVLVGLNRLA
ncbi:MAG: hypothetical protein HZB43_06985 [candidate division Zixibacteria bacterium]|nr:hypothetical protein [candidate division Zixibacteria bacterium]